MSIDTPPDSRHLDAPVVTDPTERTLRLTKVAEVVHPALGAPMLRDAIREGILPATIIKNRFYVNADEVRRIMLREYADIQESERPGSGEQPGLSSATPNQ